MTSRTHPIDPSPAAAGRTGGVPAIFLPGIIMPATLRYEPLLNELGEAVRALPKELEIYTTGAAPETYSIACEVDGISRAADAAGFDRFHLYGYSAGGACALAYVAAHPERILSLALDEPASDFSVEDLAALRSDLDSLAALPTDEKLAAFLRLNLAAGVEPPPPPTGPAPEWMASRPRGIDVFTGALMRYRLPPERLRAFDRPVYFSYGSLSHPHWVAMRERLAAVFPDFAAEIYEGLHHLETSHQREPGRVAAALWRLWDRASRGESWS